MKKENAFLQKLDKIGNLTQVVCLSLFLTGVSVQGVSAETGFPISQSVQQTKTVTGQVVDETGEPVIGASVVVEGTTNGTITDFDGSLCIARRNASLATSSDTPEISNITRPGLTTATQYSTLPFPLPIRTPRGF